MNVEPQRGIEPLHERDGAALDRDVDPLLSRALPFVAAPSAADAHETSRDDATVYEAAEFLLDEAR